MKNTSRRSFFKKSLTAFTAIALLPVSSFALKRRPSATLENIKRARGNVVKKEDVFDAFCAPQNSSIFKQAIVCDFSKVSESLDIEISKNSALDSFCKDKPNLKFCARIPSHLNVPKYLGEVLAKEKCGAIALSVTSLADVSTEPFIFALKKASEYNKPVYIFPNSSGSEFSSEIGDMLVGQAILKLVENGIFKNLPKLKVVVSNSGSALLSSLASKGVECGDGGFYAPFMSNIFYLLDGYINEEFFDLIKTTVSSSQFLFASFKDGANAISRFESLSMTDEQFRRASFENAKLLFNF